MSARVSLDRGVAASRVGVTGARRAGTDRQQCHRSRPGEESPDRDLRRRAGQEVPGQEGSNHAWSQPSSGDSAWAPPGQWDWTVALSFVGTVLPSVGMLFSNVVFGHSGDQRCAAETRACAPNDRSGGVVCRQPCPTPPRAVVDRPAGRRAPIRSPTSLLPCAAISGRQLLRGLPFLGVRPPTPTSAIPLTNQKISIH